jgi:predicted Ser/Thr protein kinase
MADIQQVVLLHDRRGWSVKVILRRGGSRRYRYASEAQARYFAAVFELGPRVLPPTTRSSPRPRKRAATAALPVETAG